jgi:hypothetical protein
MPKPTNFCAVRPSVAFGSTARRLPGRRADCPPGREIGFRPTTSGLPLETDIVRAGRHVSKVPTTDSCTAARRSFFRLRFRGDGRRQRAMIGTSSPAKRRMSGRTVANLLTNLALDPFGRIPDKFCAVRAKLDDRFHEICVVEQAELVERTACWRIPRLRSAKRGAVSWRDGGERSNWQ